MIMYETHAEDSVVAGGVFYEPRRPASAATASAALAAEVLLYHLST